MTSLRERFRAHITRRRLFGDGTRPATVVVAVSGGPDSVALLDLLHHVAPELRLTLVVAHADHGIQADGRAVGQLVRALAERYGLAFELGELHLGPEASETRARAARWAWLRAVRRTHRARYVATAHHWDDQVETILLRVLRGSGGSGLAGMAARTRAGLVRPLLPFHRAELGAHVEGLGRAVYDDPANRDPRHLRSWIRSTLLPLLRERLSPAVEQDLRRLARHAARERRAWRDALDRLPALEVRALPRGFEVARPVLAHYDKALSVELLRAAARRHGLVLGPAKAAAALSLARRPSGRRVELGGGWVAEAAFDRLRIIRAPRGAPSGVLTPARAEGSAVLGDYAVRWRPEAAPARLERAAWTTWLPAKGWVVRGVRAGDRLRPLGGTGHRSVRRLLMEARVPRSARAGYPVVVRGEAILWVPGICRGADAVPGPGTPAVRIDVTDSGAA